MRVLLFIRDIFKKFPLLFLANVLLLVIASLLEAAGILTLIPVVDLLARTSLQGASAITQKVTQALTFLGIPATLGNLMAIFLAFNLLGSGFQILVKHLILRTKYALLRDLMLGTFTDFFSARWYFFSHNRQGTLFNTFIREIVVVGDAFGAMALLFASLIQLGLYLVVPFYLSWEVASISLVMALLFAFPFILLGKVNYRLGKINTSTANRISAVIQESFSSAKVILGFGNQRKSLAMLESAFDSHRKAAVESQTLSMGIPLAYYPLGILVVIISLFTARKLLVPLSETAALLYSLIKIIPAIGQLPSLKNNLDNFFPSYEQVENLRQEAKKLKQESGEKIFSGFKKEIAMKNLSFAYPGGGLPVLSEINLYIPKGRITAFVGKSGAGKSTLIDMIMGFHSPSSGAITVDDVPLGQLRIETYRQKFGYVPQESILFNLSIRENLLWANSSASEEQVRHACRQANAEEFIAELAKGFDTLVGDRGVRLSGGQIQRIALARAILRRPQILILDEATSSIDSHSERQIQQAIENIAKETTVVIIAHRLSTVIGADYIYVLKKGRIIEEGPYAQLLRQNGEFRSMLELQALEVKH